MVRRTRSKFYSEMGFRIRQVRCLNKISQDDLAERLGVSHQTVQRYETGEVHISPEAIIICARALNTPVGYFYGEDDQQLSPSNINRTGLMVAAEIMDLPDDNIRKNVYHLVRSINRACAPQDNKREQA